jgi:hypothetical protein
VIRALLRFYLCIWRYYLLSSHFHQEIVSDPDHHHYRRYSKQYKRKQSMVKNLWIGMGLITMAFPFLHVFIILSMLTTFASFSFLDETE